MSPSIPLSLVLSFGLAGCGSYTMRDAASLGSFSTPGTSQSRPEPVAGDTAPALDRCEQSEPVVLYVSPDDSNSMSQPAQLRHYIEERHSLPMLAPRPWEFFNLATWDYPAPTDADLAIHLALAQGAEPDSYVLQVALTSAVPAERAPMTLHFLVDASGSMSGAPLSLAKDAMNTMAGQLVAGDIVSVVTWDTVNSVRLAGHTVSGPSDPELLSVISRIEPGGATDLAGALAEGYRLADELWDPARINRVVLISDGGANVGVTDEELIGSHAGGRDEDGIYMVGVGVGDPSNYNDALMDRVTDLGRGASLFLATSEDTHSLLGDRFMEVMGVAARDVQIRYDLPPGFEIVAFSGEEISTNPEEVRPQHVADADSVVLHQQLLGCADAGGEIGVTVTYSDPITFEPREIAVSAPIDALLAADDPLLYKGAALFAWGRAAGGEDTLEQARSAVDDALARLPDDADLLQISALLEVL